MRTCALDTYLHVCILYRYIVLTIKIHLYTYTHATSTHDFAQTCILIYMSTSYMC